MKPYKLTSKKFKRYTIVEPDMSLYRKARSSDLKDKNTLFNAGKWVLMLVAAGAKITNLGDVKWVATEDGFAGKGTGRHIAQFVLEPETLDKKKELELKLKNSYKAVNEFQSAIDATKQTIDQLEKEMSLFQ